MTLPLIIALAVAGVGVYIAYRDPRLGAAILVGLGIVTVLYLIWEKDPTVFQTSVPSVSYTAPAQGPSADQTWTSPPVAPPAMPNASRPPTARSMTLL